MVAQARIRHLTQVKIQIHHLARTPIVLLTQQLIMKMITVTTTLETIKQIPS